MGSMAASLLVFIGFRYGAFWFQADRSVVPSFCVSLVVVAAALFFLWRLRREVPALDVRKHDEKKKGLPLKKKYIPYYIVTGVYGFQKRMRLVFAPWIIIELLAMGADTVALLGIVAHFGSSMFAPQIGKFLDRYGVKKGLVLESVTIGAIFLYAAWAVHGITSGVFTGRVEQIFAFTAYIFIMIADHFNAVHVMLMKKTQRLSGGRDGEPVLWTQCGSCAGSDGLRAFGSCLEVCRSGVGVCIGSSGLPGAFRGGCVAWKESKLDFHFCKEVLGERGMIDSETWKSCDR